MFCLEFKTGNAAFDLNADGHGESDEFELNVYEVARILEEVKQKVLRGCDEGSVFDYYGNRVGKFRIEI